VAALPTEVRQAWDERQDPSILATVGEGDVPNIIYVTCVNLHQGERVVIADNYFDKTKANILAGSRGAILFRSKGGTQYQIKGSFEYHVAGPLFDDMKTWNLPGKAGHGVAVLSIEEVYSGATKLL
jgi:predicted pyridoxine 5'-phosphate oxidase superfamily flavin-nucleotide-binding protein